MADFNSIIESGKAVSPLEVSYTRGWRLAPTGCDASVELAKLDQANAKCFVRGWKDRRHHDSLSAVRATRIEK